MRSPIAARERLDEGWGNLPRACSKDGPAPSFAQGDATCQEENGARAAKLEPRSEAANPWNLLRGGPLAGIVVGVDVGQREWAHAVDLDYGRGFRHRIVVHLRGQKGIAARGQLLHRALVELVPHADGERARENRDVLIGRVPVRIDPVTGRHLEPDDE